MGCDPLEVVDFVQKSFDWIVLHGKLGGFLVKSSLKAVHGNELPISSLNMFSLPKTNIAPENGWLEYCFPFEKPYFQVLC